MRLLCLFRAALLVAAIVIMPSMTLGQITNTLIDFEAPGFDQNSTSAVGDAGFDFFFSSIGGTPAFGDFSGFIPSAPNLDINAPSIVTVAAGADAISGGQSLVFFTDVNSGLFQDDPAVNADPRVLQLNVFQQQSITAADIGNAVTYDFLFSGGAGVVNTDPSTTVEAFLLTLDPNNGFATTNEVAFDLSVAALGAPQTGSLTLDLTDPNLAGQTLQFGFRNAAADGQNPGVVLDDLSLTVSTAVPEPNSLALLSLIGLCLTKRRRHS